jgi:altronate hydrolase
MPDRAELGRSGMTELELFQRKALQVGSQDNVAVALSDLSAGDTVVVGGSRSIIHSSVPAKHKFALRDLKAGDSIIMYGVVVGQACEPIPAGEMVSAANTRHQSASVVARAASYKWRSPDVTRWKDRTFLGFARADGQVGTRNYWLVIPLVFCENRNIRVLQEAFEQELGMAAPGRYRKLVADLVHLHRTGRSAEITKWEFQPDLTEGTGEPVFSNLDGVKFLTHEMGCGGTRDDARTLCGLLAGYLHNPNVAGATVLSLGCQNAQVSILREEIHKRNPKNEKPLLMFDQQGSELESIMLPKAIRSTFVELAKANEMVRTLAPLSKLTIGLKCGGSDGFSGITANPVVGHLSDQMSELGGKTILSEFPELCGVEQDLVDRCQNDATAERFLRLMQTYAATAQAAGSGFDKNPSPGNIRDGLITGAMKSAGAARKGGRAPVADVFDYPEYATAAGLNLLCTPGNDVESVSGQVGAGANLVLFTTGLGTPTGNPIAPVVKISTNSKLAARMHDIIDFDCGIILTENRSVEDTCDALLETVIRVASGEVRTKAEQNHQDDFIPWKRGVSL